MDLFLTELAWWNRDTGQVNFVGPDDSLAPEFLTRATSGPDGTFVIETALSELSPRGVVAGLEATKAGLARVRVRKGASGSYDVDLGEVPMRPGIRIAGHVEDILGRRLADVGISVIGNDRSLPEAIYIDRTRSNGDGTFAIEGAMAVQCKLDAEADDGRRASVELDLRSGAPRLDVQVILPELNGADSISGVVVNPDGEPIPQAWILKRMTSGPGVPLFERSGCDAKGRFRIDGRPDSVFELVAGDKDVRWCPIVKSDIHSGTHGIVLALDGGKTFLLRVRDSSGAAIERYGYERRSGGPTGQNVRVDASEHPAGEVRLASDLAPFELTVFAFGFGKYEGGELDPATLPEIVEVVLHRACVVSGIVLPIAEGYANTQVRIAESKLLDPVTRAELEPQQSSVRANNDGRFEISIDGTGTVRLEAIRGPARSALSASIAVAPGQDVEGITLKLVRSGTLEGSVTRSDGTPGVGLELIASRGEEVAGSAKVEADGKYRILGLGEGRHEISVRAHRGVQLATVDPNTNRPQVWSVDIPEGQAARLDVRLLDSVKLRIALNVPAPEGTLWRHALWTVDAGSNELALLERQAPPQETLEVEFMDPTDAWVELKCVLPGWPRVITERRSFERGEHTMEVSFDGGRIEGSLGRPFSAEDRVRLTWNEKETSAIAEVGVDPAGRFAFPCAPAGDCTLSRMGASGPGKAVKVVAGETVLIEGL